MSSGALLTVVTLVVGAVVSVVVAVLRSDDAAVPPATAPDTTAAPVTVVPTTGTPTTVAPVVAIVDDLVAALPTAAELPAGFTTTATPPITDPLALTGPFDGYCTGENAAARAEATGAVAMVMAPDARTDRREELNLMVVAFANPSDAAAFTARTLAQVQCSGVTYTVPESTADLFGGDYGPDASWNVVESVATTPAPLGVADEAFDTAMTREFRASYGGFDYGTTVQTLGRYLRVGSIVIEVSLLGGCCSSGFSDVDPARDYVPTTADLDSTVAVVLPVVLARLAERGLL